jgi:2-methylcitrate dehydratase PrpD
MSALRQLVRALRTCATQPLPPSVRHAARWHFLDALGVGLAAASAQVGAPYRELGRSLAVGGPSTVLGQALGAAPADAALVNGGLMHSLEFDDTHTGSIIHGSSVVASAALAMAQARHSSGAAMLGAYVRGWEALARMGLAAPGGFHAQGFQASSVAGTLASAWVGAELAGLSEDQAVAALGIALSQSSGVMEFVSNGSSVKSLHPGWAAHSGLLAVQLAQAGMTGPETALDGRWGLFAQFAHDRAAAERFTQSLADLGQRWHMPDAAIKFHPCCHYLHPFIEAAGLLAQRGIEVSQIKSLVCEVPEGAAPIICEPWSRALNPANGHAARWSLPITVALRWVEGRVDVASFERSATADVRALAQKISWVPLADARFPQRFEAVITCELTNGEKITQRIDDVDGNHTRPPSDARVLAKFNANAALTLKPEGVVLLQQTLQNLDSASQVTAIGQALGQLLG